MGVLGDTLRQARAQKGVTLKEAEQATRINRHYLSALEDENFAVLPALIYQRGIVRSYAAYLALDPGKLLLMFEEARGGESTADLVAAIKPLEISHHWAPNFAIITFMVVMAAIVFAWVYSLTFSEPETLASMTEEVATVTPIPQASLALAAQTPVMVEVPATPAEGTLPQSRSNDAAPAGGENSVGDPAGQPTPAPTGAVLPTAAVAEVASVQQVLPTPTPAVTNTPPPAPAPTPSPVVAPAAADAPPPAASAGTATIRIIAQGDVTISVTGDGVSYYSGFLPSGSQTEWYTASLFEVYTSDGKLTLFENAETGESFFMGYGLNETYNLGG